MKTHYSAVKHERWMKACGIAYGAHLGILGILVLTLLVIILGSGWGPVLMLITLAPIVALLLVISSIATLWVLSIRWDWWAAMLLPLLPAGILVAASFRGI